jgi:hypothetical protein
MSTIDFAREVAHKVQSFLSKNGHHCAVVDGPMPHMKVREGFMPLIFGLGFSSQAPDIAETVCQAFARTYDQDPRMATIQGEATSLIKFHQMENAPSTSVIEVCVFEQDSQQ